LSHDLLITESISIFVEVQVDCLILFIFLILHKVIMQVSHDYSTDWTYILGPLKFAAGKTFLFIY